jgi:hypothetical protein
VLEEYYGQMLPMKYRCFLPFVTILKDFAQRIKLEEAWQVWSHMRKRTKELTDENLELISEDNN